MEIEAEKLSIMSMSIYRDLPHKVIDNGIIKQWVGIGWVEEGKADAVDYSLYPKVIRSKK